MNIIRKSIAAKILLYLIIVTFVAATISIIFTTYPLLKSLEEQTKDDLEIQAQANQSAIIQLLENYRTRVSDFSSDGFIRDGAESIINNDNNISIEQLNEHLIRNKQALSNDIIGISILNIDGVTISSTANQEIGRESKEEDYFTDVVSLPYGDSRVFYRSNTQLFGSNRDTSTSVIIVSTPLKEKVNRQGIGVITVYFQDTAINSLVNNINRGIDTSGELSHIVYLVGKDGTLLYSNLGNSVSNSDIIYPAYANCENTLLSAESYTNYLDKFVIGKSLCLVDYEWLLVTEISQDHMYEFLARAVIYLPLQVTIIGAIAVVIIYISIKRVVVKRIRNLLEVSSQIGMKEFIQEEEHMSDDEIGQLYDHLKSVGIKLQNSYQNLQEQLAGKTKALEESLQALQEKNTTLSDSQNALYNVLDDINEEKDLATALSQDLQKFQLAVKNSSDGIYILNSNSEIEFVNDAFLHLTGLSESKVIGQKMQNIWKDKTEGSYEESLEFIKKHSRHIERQITLKLSEKKTIIVFEYIIPIYDESKNIIFYTGILRDVTKEKEVDRMKTEFVSLASHQLRTPLSAINWYTEMLMAGDAGKLNSKQKDFLVEIYNGNKRMVDLVNSLLNVSRIDLGTFAIDPQPTNITEIADSIIKELTPQIEKKKQKVTAKYGKDIPIMNVDPKLTRIIFQNLLSNAVKYTPEKGTISLDITKDKTNLNIIISDTGYGIPKDQQKKIFSKLFRADNIRDKEAEGTGLGLYIVKSIIETAGGEITFKSEENKGTTFNIKLPLKGMKVKEGTKGLS